MKKKKTKKVKLIKNAPYEIEWVDTFTYNGWFTEKEIDEKVNNSSVCLSIGYFIKEKNGFIILAGGREIGSDDFLPYNTPKFIPIGYIKSIRRL